MTKRIYPTVFYKRNFTLFYWCIILSEAKAKYSNMVDSFFFFLDFISIL